MDVLLRPLSLGGAGLRGQIGTGLTPEAVMNFASAFGTLHAGRGVLLGIDTRPSSQMLRQAVIAALCGCGCRVIDGGVMHAGMMHVLIPRLGLDGGLLITGGHQAAGWNAIIPMDAEGAYYDDLRRGELFDLYHGKRFFEAGYDQVGTVEPLPERAERWYWEFVERSVDSSAIHRAGLTLIGDFCNGAGSSMAAKFASLFGIRLIAVNDSPCGSLPRDPEPRPRSESPIRAVIEPLGAAAGLVFNSDMSRMGILTDGGEPLSEEMTFPLAADYLLEKWGAGAVVVGNCCSSRTLDDVVRRRGGLLEKVKVGQAQVVAGMKRLDSSLGGEGSGAFTFGTLRGFDGFLMAALLLEMIAVRGQPLSMQLRNLSRYHIVKKTIPCRSSHGYALLRRLKGRFGDAKVSEIDGLRFDWEDGWLSLRLSSTEPVIRLISESKRKSTAQERAWQARSLLENRVGK